MSEVQNKETVFPVGKAVKKAYAEGQEDEALEPIIACDASGKPVGRMQGGEQVIFYDIRGEREIEITQSLTDPGFSHFPVQKNTLLNFVTMIEYDSGLDVKVAFPPDGRIRNSFAEVVTNAGFSLLKIAETEKAVHVTYFMNGKNEEPFSGEERVLVPSPEGIASYSTVPEMCAAKVRSEIAARIKDAENRMIIANLANVDVVGHIDEKQAVLKAIKCVDSELGRIVDLCREQKVTLVVTADHGTVEEWLYPDGNINTGHTKNPVPFILLDFGGEEDFRVPVRTKGELIDVAPTLLDLLGLCKPEEMTGLNLLEGDKKNRKKRRVLLLILDGWGIRSEKHGNLIAEADTPNFDRLWTEYPHSVLEASGEAVGMPPGTVGNSEAGHLHIGSGRRILLDRVKIDRAVENGSFFRNEAFLAAMEESKSTGKPLHLLGIVSFYSSHGTIKHLFALLEMAKQQDLDKVYIHALLGRRGERPESGSIYIRKVEEKCMELGIGRVATVIGRYWALDREENWDRIEKAYRAFVFGEGTKVIVS